MTATNAPHDQAADLLALQRAAFLRDGPPTLKQRRADLKRLKKALVSRRTQIEMAVNADFGHRSAHETALMDIFSVTQGIDYLHRNLARFTRPTRRHVAPAFQLGSARIEYQPLGVVGIVSPWNYPLSLGLMPLATAIAAGNRAMLKPSELTPATSALLATILAAEFRQEQVAVVTGDASVGAAFSALPFDHLIFTGSTPVGSAVMRAASEHLVPVTLELGGKSPVIVQRGADLKRAAKEIAYGKLANAGQTCVGPDYLILHEGDVQPFLDAYEDAVTALYPDGPASDDFTSIVSERHYARLQGLLADARAHGAQVTEVGHNADAANGRAHTLAPAVVLGATDDMQVMREEIFGPVLPIMTYSGIDDAIAYVNAHPRPLALYYFGDNGAERSAVLERTTSGNVAINTTLTHYMQDDLPFGGVGPSGIGAYHGIEGFRTFSHAKGIYDQGRWNLSSLLRPPFGPLADRMLSLLLR